MEMESSLSSRSPFLYHIKCINCTVPGNICLTNPFRGFEHNSVHTLHPLGGKNKLLYILQPHDIFHQISIFSHMTFSRSQATKKYQLPLGLLYSPLLFFSFHIVRIHLSDINIVHWSGPFSYVSSGFSSEVLLFTNVQENSQARRQTWTENWKNFITFKKLSPCIVLPVITAQLQLNRYSYLDDGS